MSGTGERFVGKHTIFGVDGEHSTPYMTRIWIGRLRLHIFHRGDADLDCHDHPWDFWTFPLTPYAEEVATPLTKGLSYMEALFCGPENYKLDRQVVPAFRLTYRPATHCHRVIGPVWRISPDRSLIRKRDGREVYSDDAGHEYAPDNTGTKIITFVWRGGQSRRWGFLKNRNGQWCWIHWKEYVFNGGKSAPCSPEQNQSQSQGPAQ